VTIPKLLYGAAQQSVRTRTGTSWGGSGTRTTLSGMSMAEGIPAVVIVRGIGPGNSVQQVLHSNATRATMFVVRRRRRRERALLAQTCTHAWKIGSVFGSSFVKLPRRMQYTTQTPTRKNPVSIYSSGATLTNSSNYPLYLMAYVEGITSPAPTNLHTFPRSIPVSDSQVSIRPRTKRAQVFGYPPRLQWILDFGQKHNVDPEGVKSEFGCLVDSVELIRDELIKDGGYALVRSCGNAGPSVAAQIYVARNYLHPMRGSTPGTLLFANVEKLQKFLDTTDEPQWMNI
jgi:hypothetical protein